MVLLQQMLDRQAQIEERLASRDQSNALQGHMPLNTTKDTAPNPPLPEASGLDLKDIVALVQADVKALLPD